LAEHAERVEVVSCRFVVVQVKRLKRDLGVMVVVLAVGPQWWIDIQQLHSIASYPTSRSVIIRRRVTENDVELARMLHSLVCEGISIIIIVYLPKVPGGAKKRHELCVL